MANLESIEALSALNNERIYLCDTKACSVDLLCDCCPHEHSAFAKGTSSIAFSESEILAKGFEACECTVAQLRRSLGPFCDHGRWTAFIIFASLDTRQWCASEVVVRVTTFLDGRANTSSSTIRERIPVEAFLRLVRNFNFHTSL